MHTVSASRQANQKQHLPGYHVFKIYWTKSDFPLVGFGENRFTSVLLKSTQRNILVFQPLGQAELLKPSPRYIVQFKPLFLVLSFADSRLHPVYLLSMIGHQHPACHRHLSPSIRKTGSRGRNTSTRRSTNTDIHSEHWTRCSWKQYRKVETGKVTGLLLHRTHGSSSTTATLDG